MSHSLHHELTTLLQQYPDTGTVWIAYSGGLDSHVLLDSCAQIKAQCPQKEFKAIHVHHGLQDSADTWAQHCQGRCEEYGITCEIKQVSVSQQQGESVEEQARHARYTAFAECVQQGDMLLIGQHADDQAETLLLQLMRGAGVAGLSAMPRYDSQTLTNTLIIRPLLEYTREQLQQYAEQQGLKWIEDPSNQDPRFTRNFIRHHILPPLKQRWQTVSHTLSRAATHQAEAQQLLTELAENDLQQCGDPQKLSCLELEKLSPARQRNLVRYWVKQAGYRVPSQVKLAQILHQMLTAETDKNPCVDWENCQAQRYQQHIYILPQFPAPSSQPIPWHLNLNTKLTLPYGVLQCVKTSTGGINRDLLQDAALTIRFRQGKEKILLRGQHKSVKKLLNSAHIPPWERALLPLIYHGEQLIAIPEIGIDDTYYSKEGVGVFWQR